MHRRRRWRAVLAGALSAIFSLAACRAEHAQFKGLAESIVRSIRERDATAFVTLHVQPGDTSPSGDYWLATRAGGTRPDKAWNDEVRAAFRELDRRLVEQGVRTASLELVAIEGVTTYQVDGDSDRNHLSNLSLRVTDGEREYLLNFPEGMRAQRGWVIVGDPNATLTRPRAQ